MYFKFFLTASLLLPVSAHAADIVINKIRETNSPYMLNLLELALTYSNTKYNITETPERLTKIASVEGVKRNELSVIWGGTSKQLEDELLPIRIDGYRGLMSLRFLIIRQGDQARFDNIYTLEDLKNIRFGQGRNWADGKILESAGLEVIRSNKKTGLFHMLDGGRFEAFPRGATEAWKEVAQTTDLPLTVEENLIISYHLPTYFFVNKNNYKLATAIETGLENAIADGRMDEYFYNNDRVKEFLKNANLEQRRVIQLSNPLLPKETPIDREELWLTLEEIIEGKRAYQQH